MPKVGVVTSRQKEREKGSVFQNDVAAFSKIHFSIDEHRIVAKVHCECFRIFKRIFSR